MAVCKYCMVCLKQCTDDCEDYALQGYPGELVDIECQVKYPQQYGTKKEEKARGEPIKSV